jgi:hypothetical protein
MAELRFAKGTLDEKSFERAAEKVKRMEPRNLAIAREFLVQPGDFQVVIADRHHVSKQLVYKQCRKLYDAHLAIENAQRPRDMP